MKMIEDVKVQEGWRRERLGEVIEIFDRERIPLDSEYRLTIKGSFPYCGATGVIDYMALRYFMWGDVVKWLPNNPKSEEKGRGISL
jgi:hypothetical protein